MIITHNLTEDNLLFAMDLGGLCMPSLAIIDPTKKILNNFGEITIIAKNDFFVPKKGKNKDCHIFAHDAYSPRMPSIIYTYNVEELKKQYNKMVSKIEQESNQNLSLKEFDLGINSLIRKNEGKNYDNDVLIDLDSILNLEMFLMVKGIKTELVKEDYEKKLNAFFKGNEDLLQTILNSDSIKDFFNTLDENEIENYKRNFQYSVGNLNPFLLNNFKKNILNDNNLIEKLSKTQFVKEKIDNYKNFLKDSPISELKQSAIEDFVDEFAELILKNNLQQKGADFIKLNLEKSKNIFFEQAKAIVYKENAKEIEQLISSHKNDALSLEEKKDLITGRKLRDQLKAFSKVLMDFLKTDKTLKKEMFDGYTPSGKKRIQEYNLDNVYKKMKKTIKEHGITSSESTTSLILDMILYSELKSYSLVNPPLKNLKDINFAMEKLSTSEDVKEFGENLIFNLEEEVKQVLPHFLESFDYNVDFTSVLAAYIFDLNGDYDCEYKNGNKIVHYNLKNYSQCLNNDEEKKLKDILCKYYLKLKHDQPSDYLELKYTNIIRFDNNLSNLIETIIIPENLTYKHKIKEYFEKLNINVIIQPYLSNNSTLNDENLKNIILKETNISQEHLIDNKVLNSLTASTSFQKQKDNVL